MPGKLYDDDVDVHMSAFASRSKHVRKPKRQRRVLINRYQDIYPISAYVLALIELQRIWRGVLLRRRVLAKYLHHNFVRNWKKLEQTFTGACYSIPAKSEGEFVNVTRRVQERCRAVLLRAEYQRWRSFDKWTIYYVAAATIQRAWIDHVYLRRRKHHRQRSRRFYLTRQDAAAGRIQSLFRGFVNRRVFKFYRDLIRFRQGGDPFLMLKCINPGEANLMDRAAGLHIKFRLGGAAFPPVILYKIFTHNNVADVCSFAPKDYTMARKHVAPGQLHNRFERGSGLASNLGATAATMNGGRWYVRVDNNPWQPVSDAFHYVDEKASTAPFGVHIQLQPQQEQAQRSERISFLHSRALRREQREKEKKRIRRKWLAELYTAGKDDEAVPTREDVAIARDVFDQLTDDEVEAEASKLVRWFGDLDFQNYLTYWQSLAATAPT